MFEDPKRTKKYLKIALFGKGGTGKTRFALSFPQPAVIDAEHSTDPYREKYDFKAFYTNRWKNLEAPINWIKEHPGVYETLIIDPVTIFYNDLINDLVEYAKNRRGQETMSRDLWGIEKRRYANFLNILTALPVHVILIFREKDVYEEIKNHQGEEILKKTGEFQLEADKQTEYLFDLSFRCYTEENKKEKTSKFLFTCMKSRYDWMSKYSVHDITLKRAFQEIFEEHVQFMLNAPDAPVAQSEEKPKELPSAEETSEEKALREIDEKSVADKEAAGKEKDKGGTERVGEILEKFASSGDPNEPQATIEDIKVLMTRVTDLAWPDGSPFSNTDGKNMIKALYKVESTKELRKFQVDFLYREFGEVLAGRAELARDEVGVPIVVRLSGVNPKKK